MSQDILGEDLSSQGGSLALARKWRPHTFAEVIGQEQAVRTLTAALSSGRLHHAYMFTGTRGVGKTTLARILAKAFNCPTPNEDGTACNACSSCKQIDEGTHPDVLEMDAASTTQVDHMREMLEGLRFAPASGRYRVCVIDEVHMLSRHSFNAMLKTLEEPPEHVKFILATTDPQQVLATVRSRCLRFSLHRLPPDLIAKHLAHVLDKEKVKYDPAALEVIAAHAEGSVRDALSILDEAIVTGECLDPAAMRELVGLAGIEHVAQLLEFLVAGEVAKALELASEMNDLGVDLAAALGELGELVHHDQLAAATGGDTSKGALEPLKAQLVFEIVSNAQPRLASAPNAKVAFEMTLLRIATFLTRTKQPKPAATQLEAKPAPASAPASVAPKASASPAQSKPSGDEVTRKKTLKPGQLDAASWHELATGSKLRGRHQVLASKCELVASTTTKLGLQISKEDKSLLEWQDELVARLRELFNGELEVTIKVAASTSETPAKSHEAELERKDQQTLTEFATSPEKQMIEDKLGAAHYDVLRKDE